MPEYYIFYSIKPEKWNVKSLIYSSVILSAFLVVEGFVFLYIGLVAKIRRITSNGVVTKNLTTKNERVRKNATWIVFIILFSVYVSILW